MEIDKTISKDMIGIYEIYNKINNKRYIGQSTHLRVRLLKHLNFLRKNKHQNKHLQTSWNKYGEDKFEIHILELCAVEDLDKKEDYYINKYKSNKKEYGYNYRIDNKTNRGLKWSPEQRKKMMYAIERNPWYHNHDLSEEARKKSIECLKNKIWTEEERKKISQRLKGTKVKDTTNMKLAQRGEKNPSSKLKEDQVKEIISLLQSKNYNDKILGLVYGVNSSNITAIRTNRSWKYIDRNNKYSEHYIKGKDKVDDYCKKNNIHIQKNKIRNKIIIKDEK